jgi:hypothetical protein
MSGGVAGTSSRASEPGDDESDRDEDQDEQPSFVCDLLAGRVGGSLRLDDDVDGEVAQLPDATPMSQTSFLPAQSQTPSKFDDNAETTQQWASFSAHYKGKAPQPQDTHFLAWRPVGDLSVAPQRNEFAGDLPGTFRGRHRPTTTM